MKKIGLVLILALALSYVKAQDNKTTTTTTPSKVTTTPAATNSRTPVKVADLPKAIQDDLTKTWAGYTTKNAFKVDRNNVISYKILVTKDTTELSLMYDKEGKFLSSKVLNPKAAKMVTPSTPAKTNDAGTKKDPIKN